MQGENEEWGCWGRNDNGQCDIAAEYISDI